jgi:hypothetical protein
MTDYEQMISIAVDYMLEHGISKKTAEEFMDLIDRDLAEEDIFALNKELKSRQLPHLPGTTIKDAADPDEIMWLDGDVDEYNQFSYDRLHHTPYSYHTDEPVEVVVPELLGGSDYSGSTYHRSNYDVFLEEFGDVDGVYSIYGGYGTFAIAIRADLMNEEIYEAVSKLKDYLILDEDALSHYESELEQEAWDNWARHDFVRGIEQEFEIEDLEERMTDDQIEELFYELCDRSNEHFFADGTDMYIRIQRVVDAVEPEDIPGLDLD